MVGNDNFYQWTRARVFSCQGLLLFSTPARRWRLAITLGKWRTDNVGASWISNLFVVALVLHLKWLFK